MTARVLLVGWILLAGLLPGQSASAGWAPPSAEDSSLVAFLPTGPDTIRALFIFAKFPNDTTDILMATPACTCRVYADYWPKALGAGMPDWTVDFLEDPLTVLNGGSRDGSISDWFYEQSQARYFMTGEVYNHTYNDSQVLVTQYPSTGYGKQDSVNLEIWTAPGSPETFLVGFFPLTLAARRAAPPVLKGTIPSSECLLSRMLVVPPSPGDRSPGTSNSGSWSENRSTSPNPAS